MIRPSVLLAGVAVMAVYLRPLSTPLCLSLRRQNSRPKQTQFIPN